MLASMPAVVDEHLQGELAQLAADHLGVPRCGSESPVGVGARAARRRAGGPAAAWRTGRRRGRRPARRPSAGSTRPTPPASSSSSASSCSASSSDHDAANAPRAVKTSRSAGSAATGSRRARRGASGAARGGRGRRRRGRRGRAAARRAAGSVPSSRTRAAASSIASGKPSSRSHSCSTCSRSTWPGSNDRSRARARSTNISDPGRVSGLEAGGRSRATGRAAAGRWPGPRRPGQRSSIDVDERGGRVDEVLAVVEDDEHPPSLAGARGPRPRRRHRAGLRSRRRRPRRRPRCRRRRAATNATPSAYRSASRSPSCDRDPGLAHAAGAGQRDQPPSVGEEAAQVGEHVLAADQPAC